MSNTAAGAGTMAAPEAKICRFATTVLEAYFAASLCLTCTYRALWPNCIVCSRPEGFFGQACTPLSFTWSNLRQSQAQADSLPPFRFLEWHGPSLRRSCIVPGWHFREFPD